MATAFVAVATPACAHNWYMIDQITNQCTNTTAPSVEMDSLREQGFDPQYSENRPDGSDLASVDVLWVNASGANQDLTLFTSLGACQAAVQGAVNSGQLNNPKDLN